MGANTRGISGTEHMRIVGARMENMAHLPALNLELTSKCQVKCVWCLMQTFDKIRKEHMEFAQFRRFVAINADYLRRCGTRITPFSRGEPLLYPRFWECCAILRKEGLAIGSMATNLSVRIRVRDFLENPIDYIVVNLGGTTKEVHESVMLHSRFELVVENLRKLWAAGVPVHVKINPARPNIPQLAELPQFVEYLGGKPEYAQEYTTMLPHPDDASPEEIRYFMTHVYDPEHPELFRFAVRDGALVVADRGCPAGLMVDTIFADGGLSVCCHDHHQQSVVGNAFDVPLEELRSSPRYRGTYLKGLRRRLRNCRFCA